MVQTEKLPFGGSHWDYLPDLHVVQNYIQDLAARSLHCDRMEHVCQSIKHLSICRGLVFEDFEEIGWTFMEDFFRNGR